MRFTDKIIQSWRMRTAARWVPDGARVLDIGCHQGEFLEYLGSRIGKSVGIDPLAPHVTADNYQLISSSFLDYGEFIHESFDTIVMLATLEHMHDLEGVAHACARLLRPHGRVVATVPSPSVDRLLNILIRMRVLDGMSYHEHRGLSPDTLPNIFKRASLSLRYRRSFQFGLNNLFVFEKDEAKSEGTAL